MHRNSEERASATGSSDSERLRTRALACGHSKDSDAITRDMAGDTSNWGQPAQHQLVRVMRPVLDLRHDGSMWAEEVRDRQTRCVRMAREWADSRGAASGLLLVG